MSDLRRCPRCGASLDPLDPDGRCAACLLELAMGSGIAPDQDTDDALPGPAATQIGPYRILEILGEGGMGIVYLAEQQHPLRRMALKLVRAGMNSARADFDGLERVSNQDIDPDSDFDALVAEARALLRKKRHDSNETAVILG